jgi:hypothetical protein
MAGKWPDWAISKNGAWQLALYVDPEAAEVPLGAHLRSQWSEPDEAVARAAELYRIVSERHIEYARDPWNPARFGSDDGQPKQRIRTPAEVLQGAGSCLDLSLLFAGLAIAANIRPFIALTLDAPTPHALAVLDLSGPLNSMHAVARTEGPEFWRSDDEGHGVWRPQPAPDSVTAQAMPWWRLSRSHWLAVDISCAARANGVPPQDFGEACWTQLFPECSGRAVTWMLVDVDAAQEDQEPYQPPVGRARYPIHSYLPELPEFRDYPTRQGLVRDLSATIERRIPARLILQGPGGRGKSLLAQRLAWQADNGCGWFLNATDVETLQASLAAAEQAETGRWTEGGDRAERPDPTEVKQLAYAALSRLAAADVPWVVVLDNCDKAPDAPGLQALIPQPGSPGQIVIMTTREEGWSGAPGDWTFTQVPALGTDDLGQLGLPQDAVAIVRDPLVAEPLAELATRGVAIPPDTRSDPHRLVWALVRDVLGAASPAVRLAELLAWLPPEPAGVAAAPAGAGPEALRQAAEELVRLRFLTPVSQSGRAETVRVRMHRMFADTIRAGVWADGEQAVLKVLADVLTSGWGRSALIESADQTALQRLEGGELQWAANGAADRRMAGGAWHGLGHIRERRGPVAQSKPAFEAALEYLDPASAPYQKAEAEIGLARIAFQARQFDRDKLQEARARIGPARDLVAGLHESDARQLHEQGNALSWLIARKLAGREKDPNLRLSLLSEVGNELWRSYEQRLRIRRGLADNQAVNREPPQPGDGLGPERAYYNLAGLDVELAKARYDHAAAWWPTATADRKRALLDRVKADLDEASQVYRVVAGLRALKYRDRPHPHHAACIHGNAIVDYHRAALLNEPEHLVDAARWVTAGLQERWQVASFAPNVASEQVIANDDVGKSLALLAKISVAWSMLAGRRSGDQVGSALAAVSEAVTELVNWTTFER